MWDWFASVFSQVFSLLSVVAAAIIAARSNMKVTRTETERAPYTEVADRATKLERTNRALSRLVNLYEERERVLLSALEDLGHEPAPRSELFFELEREAFGEHRT